MVTQTFLSKSDNKTQGYPIGYLLSRSGVRGDIGIEIEVEGNTFEKTKVPPPWRYEKDGSLRGKDNAEYVLQNPIAFGKVPEALAILWDLFDKTGSILDVSNRTSVHVHLNCQGWYVNRLAVFCAMYMSVEELLTEWCGEHRVGNLFCLRGKDAHYIVSEIKRFIKKDCRHSIAEGMHYAGLNIHALPKYGSIEVRSLRGVADPTVILTWVQILERMYKISADLPDPRTLIADFSGTGAEAYLNMILGDNAVPVVSELGWMPDQLRQSVYEGIRLAQDICYCRNWSMYEPVEMVADPFGRMKAKDGSDIPPPSGLTDNSEPDYDPEPEEEPIYDDDD